jgi:pimeloyl-ACP methyl ester carboxylesterase
MNIKRSTKIIRLLGIVAVILSIVYLLGPKPNKPTYVLEMDTLPEQSDSLEAWIAAGEARLKLKPNNEARIIWRNDSLKEKTEYAIVYLHGFSASQEEGDPVHRTIARTFGCNLYLSRLSMHGIDTTEPLLGITAENYWESAQQALNIGRQLGKKVILMGTSTGGTQALQLAAAYPKEVASIILMSPNIEINDPSAWLLNNPWGLQIARMVIGSDYIVAKDTRPVYKNYWSSPYRMEATVELQEMLETSMKAATFQRVTQPLLLMYYYKDEANQDPVVRVSAMRKMFENISTPMSLKKEVAIPNAGDHVIGCHLKSGDVGSVIKASADFMQQVMKIPIVDSSDQAMAIARK